MSYELLGGGCVVLKHIYHYCSVQLSLEFSPFGIVGRTTVMRFNMVEIAGHGCYMSVPIHAVETTPWSWCFHFDFGLCI